MPAPGDAAGAGSRAAGHKVCSHPHRMSHLIENNQSGRNNFLSFIRRFLLPSPIPVPSLPGHTPDNLPSTMRSMCVAHFFLANSILRTSAKYFKWSNLPSLTWKALWSWISHHYSPLEEWLKAHTGGKILKLLDHTVGIQSRKQELGKHSRPRWTTSLSVNGLGFRKHYMLVVKIKLCCPHWTTSQASSTSEGTEGFSARFLFQPWPNHFISP